MEPKEDWLDRVFERECALRDQQTEADTAFERQARQGVFGKYWREMYAEPYLSQEELDEWLRREREG